ncbi:MAG: formimidoylglutamase [Proteobacteria bacterium]|jgi:formiminoglutamase|nr:formimidoylglutamase [Pseudomonadota bacterium]
MKLFAPSPSLIFKKADPLDPRLGNFTEVIPPFQKTLPKDLVLWGYPDDEGISLSGGRPGASQAPDRIREFFYKMTPTAHLRAPHIGDLGNLSEDRLRERHQSGSQLAEYATKEHLFWTSLGGGHDYGYADGAGFLRATLAENLNEKPLVLNFDAHLDVRPDIQGASSGTPFFRLINEFNSDFEFWELGIQPQCNAAAHFDWVTTRGGTILSLEAIENAGGLRETFQKHLMPNLKRPLWISLDIDSFSRAYAPGCSQSFATGFEPPKFLQGLDYLFSNFDVRGLSIYEVSPPLDLDNATSKLAALVIHRSLSLNMRKA